MQYLLIHLLILILLYQGCISTDRAIDIASILSRESRRAVVLLCASATHGDSSRTNLPSDLLMRVFSRSLWVDEMSATGSESDNNFMGDENSKECQIWNWLKHCLTGDPDKNSQCMLSAPVGSWFSLVSVYTSSLESIKAMVTFWLQCIEEVRVHWENKVPIPRLSPPVPIIKLKNQQTSEVEENDIDNTSSESLGSVWLEPLWDDLVLKYRKSMTPFDLPDLLQNLPYQKLQMINMCIICGEESNLYQ